MWSIEKWIQALSLIDLEEINSHEAYWGLEQKKHC